MNFLKKQEPLFYSIITFLLYLFISVLIIGLCSGIILSLLDIRMYLSDTLQNATKQLLVNALLLFAVVEIIKTALIYVSEGRVKVSYIVDTVLIILLKEAVVIVFNDLHTDKIFPLCILLFTVMIMRFLAIRYHPEER